MSFEYELRDAMNANGFPYGGNLHTYVGTYHQFTSENGDCKNKCCRYRIFESQLGAHITCWRRDNDFIWFQGNYKKLSIEEKEILQKERDDVRDKRNAAYAKATSRCIKFLFKAITYKNNAPIHPYVKRKHIPALTAITCRKMLVIPVLDIDYQIQTLQFIMPNGFKKFKTGGKSSGGMIWLCRELPDSYDSVIRVCEGWSTGCTIAEMTKSPVICALNAYNLPIVVQALKQRYVNANIHICADNDQWKKENTGLKYAEPIAKRLGCVLHYPIFDNFDISKQPTDFNDLLLLADSEEVKRQIILNRN